MAANMCPAPASSAAVNHRVPWLPVVGLAALKVAVTMPFAGRYGWHRDELYYLASARHLQLGYVDYPPVTPAIARLVQVVAPESLVALRFASVLAGTVVVVLVALIARDLGGGRRAQALAALAVVISPMFLGGNFLFETSAAGKRRSSQSMRPSTSAGRSPNATPRRLPTP
jgi:hypothetical protein